MNEAKISIIGGGLSAIYSYWGCLDADYDPSEIEVLYTDMSVPIGAVFMYESPIPWQPQIVMSALLGTCDGYSLNQWDCLVETSAHRRFQNGKLQYVNEYLYMLDDLLVTLWGMIPRKSNVGFLEGEQVYALKERREAVICTFPARSLRQRYAEKGYFTKIPIYHNQSTANNHVVLYNGANLAPWVRQTVVPGKIFTEYAALSDISRIMSYEEERGNGGGKIQLLPDLLPETPPLSWDERIEDNLFSVGRVACFTPGYLSHQARRDTAEFLGGL